MQWKSVVLPAPFGPISPTISPAPIARETSLLATRPPKRFVTALSSRRGATLIYRGGREAGVHRGWPETSARRSSVPREPARGRAPREPARPATPRERQDPGRAERRDQDDDDAVDDQVDPAARERSRPERRGHDLRDRDQDHRPQHRAPEAADPADHRGHDRQRAPVEVEHLLRKDRERPEAVEDAARREDRRRDAARDHLVEPAVDSDPLRALLVVADRAEVEAELRALDEPEEPERERQEPERDVVVAERLGAAGELQARRRREYALPGLDRDEEAAAPVDELPRRADRLRDHPDRHRGDREVVAAQARERIGHEGADPHRREHPGQHAEPGAPAEVHEEDRGRVRADREEHLGPEVELARPATDDVPAGAEHRVEQDQEADGLEVGVAAPLERDRVGEAQGEAGGEGDARPEPAARTAQGLGHRGVT